MGQYLVRVAGTRKVLGIFWAETSVDLWDAVDEMADPGNLEWAEIEEPGGVWFDLDSRAARGIPDPRDFPEGGAELDEAFYQVTRSGLNCFTDHLGLMLVDQDKHDWTRFDAADEGDGVIARIAREFGRD